MSDTHIAKEGRSYILIFALVTTAQLLLSVFLFLVGFVSGDDFTPPDERHTERSARELFNLLPPAFVAVISAEPPLRNAIAAWLPGPALWLIVLLGSAAWAVSICAALYLLSLLKPARTS